MKRELTRRKMKMKMMDLENTLMNRWSRFSTFWDSFQEINQMRQSIRNSAKIFGVWFKEKEMVE
jgi:hypothetical protein